MNIIRISVCTLLCSVLLAPVCQAQVKKLWNKSFSAPVNWQQVTAQGHYIAGTPKGIMAIDPNNGAILWEASAFSNLSSEQVLQAGGSPLLAVNQGTDVYMLDPFNGKVRFDSRKAGVAEIRDQFVLYKANGILISGKTTSNKDILLFSSMANGEVAWKIEEDFGRLVTAEELSADELLIVTIFYNYRVNAKTGKIIWKNDVSNANAQMAKMGALGGLMKQAAANMAQDIEFNVQFYRHPKDPVFIIASESQEQGMGSADAVSYKTTYTGFSLNDGSQIWSKPLETGGRLGPVYLHNDGLVVLPNNGMNTKVNMYDYASQEGKWGKKGKGVKVKGGIYSYAPVDGGLMLVSQNGSGKNFLSYLDTKQGLLTFEKPVKVDGEVVFTKNTPKGLLYITTEEANILNISDGSLVLDKSITTAPALATEKDGVLYAYDTKDGVLKSLDTKTGTVKMLSDKIKFEGKESPSNLETRGDGILLTSSQNLMLVDYTGKIKFQKYYEAPREPGLMRALRYAQAVRAAYIGAAAYSASAAFQTAGEQAKADDPVAGAMASGIGQAYGQLGDAATDFAVKSFQMANARFKATQQGDDYMVILTTQDKSNTLVKVNKATGEIEGNIDLGKEREPDYTMDGVTGQVFFKNAEKDITAFQF